MNNNYEDVVEINLRSLFFYVLSKWKWILAFFLIGAIAGGIVSYVNMQNSTPENLEKRVEKIDITDESKFNMEKIRQVADYQKLYDTQIAKDEDSFLLKMDPTKVYSSTITYYVFTNDQNINVIDTYLDNILNRDGQWEKLREASGAFCTENALKDLVSVWFNPSAVPEQINVEGDSTRTRGGILSVSITAPDESSRASMKEFMSGLTTGALEELKKNYTKDYSYIEISNRDHAGFGDSVITTIKNNADNRKALQDNLNNLKKALNQDEADYYACYYENETKQDTASLGFSKKSVAFGAVIGAVLLALWFAVKYLLDRHVKDADDVLLKGIPVLAEIEGKSEPKKGIDRWIYNWLNKGKSVLQDSAYLKQTVGDKAFSKALISGNRNDADVTMLMDELTAADSRLVSAGMLSSDAAAVETAKDADALILIVHAMKDYRDEVRKTLQVAKTAGKQLLGAVIIR